MAIKLSQPGKDPKYLAKALGNQEEAASGNSQNSDYFSQGINNSFSGTNESVLKEREAARPIEPVDTTGKMNYKNAGNHLPKKAKGSIKAVIKTKGPMGAIAALILGGGTGITFFLGGAAAPMAFVANVVDDLNDQFAAMDIGQGHLLRNKIPGTTKKQVVAGCTKLSIRCKFQTMGKSQIEAYKRAGIKVEGTDAFAGRVKPTSFEYKGTKYDASKWVSELKTNTDVRYASKRALNMKYMGFNDKTFIGKTLKRFGISRKPPELTGPHKNRVNVLMGKAGVSSIDGINLKPAVNADGQPVDKDGNVVTDTANQAFELEGDTSGTRYSAKEVETMNNSIKRVSAARPPSRAKATSIGLISAIGYMDLLCTIKNMIGAASVAAKVANQVAMAQYIMPLASLAGKMKAGEISAEDAAALIEVFNKTDSRTEILDIDGEAEATEDVATKPNPNYGKSMMDSPLYKMASTGQLNSLSASEIQYSLGMSQNKLLSAVSNGASIANAVGEVAGCDIVQSGVVRVAGLIAGVALAVGSFGSGTVVQIGISLGLVAVMMILDNMLNNALTGTVVQEDIDEAPLERAAIGFTGLSAISGESARSRGLMPGNADQITNYLEVRNEVDQDYIAMEKQDAKPFDIYNKYSFLGSFAQSIINYTRSANGPMSIIGNMSSIVTNAVPIALGTNTAMAKVIDRERFTQCDDEVYNDEDLDIDADVQCNVRYIMSDEDLTLESDEVATWMEENGYVDVDTETGLPPGYTPIDPEANQNFAASMLSGAVNSMFSTRIFNEYGYFLDYCAYRALPFGETYQESGALGAPDKRWLTGAKCRDGGEVAYFRMYTLFKSIQSAEDDEPVDTYQAANAPAAETGSTVVSGDWARPNAAAYNKTSNVFGTPVSYNSGAAGHNGVDLNGSRQPERVYAGCTGTASTSHAGEYTTASTSVIVIDCGGGITVGYHHAVLEAGSSVTAGQDIGVTDASGNWAGYHLHLTVKVNGVFVDPIPFFAERGINLL